MRKVEANELSEFLIELFNISEDNLYMYYSESSEYWRVEIKTTWEYIEFDYEKMKAISEFMDTTKISSAEFSKSNGCSTCDYGATYYSEFTIG